MACDRGLREVFDLFGFADVDPMNRDLLRRVAGDLGRQRRQPRVVAIRQRQVAAARGKLERQRPADATGRSGYGCGGSAITVIGYRLHFRKKNRSYSMAAKWIIHADHAGIKKRA